MTPPIQNLPGRQKFVAADARRRTTFRFSRMFRLLTPAVTFSFLCAAIFLSHVQAGDKISQSIYSVLRAPLPPEELDLSQNRTEFVIQGPTFNYRVSKRTGVIASIRVVRDAQEVISS